MSTIDACYRNCGEGDVPGIKDQRRKWDLRGHRERILTIGEKELELFAEIYDEPGTTAMQARLPILHSKHLLEVLKKSFRYPAQLSNISNTYHCTRMWYESSHQKDKTIRRETRFANNLTEWVANGPHLFVATPLSKTPRRVCSTHRAYDSLDLTYLPDDYLPRTNYLPACEPAEYARRSPCVSWSGKEPVRAG